MQKVRTPFTGRSRRSGFAKFKTALAASALIGLPLVSAFAGPFPFKTALAVSHIQYDGNSFGSDETYPTIFNDPSVSGVQGSIHVDQYLCRRLIPREPEFTQPSGGLASSLRPV